MHLPDRVLEELLAERTLGAAELLAYLVAWVAQPRSVAELAAKSRIARATAARACDNLVSTGWLAVDRCRRGHQPVALIPRRCQEELARHLENQYELASNKGEFLMKRYLDLRVASDEYVDNARPESLQNPLTDEHLEYDRLYLQGIAFEFNGPQHSERTKRYSSEKTLRETKARDLMKKGLSVNAQR